jgi:hypothetical protein
MLQFFDTVYAEKDVPTASPRPGPTPFLRSLRACIWVGSMVADGWPPTGRSSTLSVMVKLSTVSDRIQSTVLLGWRGGMSGIVYC